MGYLARNEGYEQIKTSTEKWLQDQLEVIGKFEVTAPDITLINFIREQCLKHFIPDFTADLKEAIALTSEIDLFLLGATTIATDTYSNVLHHLISIISNGCKFLSSNVSLQFKQ